MDGFLPNIIKYLLFATNFLVFIMACVVLGFGIYALADGSSLVKLVNDGAGAVGANIDITVYTTAAIILIVVSVFVIIVTFFGCCGAIKESKCMLGTYFAIILIMFIIMIIGAVIGYSQSLNEIKKPLLDSMKLFNTGTNPSNNKSMEATTNAWNQVQRDYDCCGVDHYTDWTGKGQPNPYPIDARLVPASCCDMNPWITGDGINTCIYRPEQFNTTVLPGCFKKFQESLNSNSKNVLAVGITIVVFMFLNMIFAFALCMMVH